MGTDPPFELPVNGCLRLQGDISRDLLPNDLIDGNNKSFHPTSIGELPASSRLGVRVAGGAGPAPGAPVVVHTH